jgi:endonuclease-3
LIFKNLSILFPDARIALIFSTPWELMVAVILSAQCTDVRVNKITPKLFRAYPTVFSFASAHPADLEKLIYSTGFYHAKARHIIAAARMIVSVYDGVVPGTMDALLKLPGVGRKTANVILHEVFGVSDGITVDTHVRRLSMLFGLTVSRNPVLIERDLMVLFPRSSWRNLSHLFILYGRTYCAATCRHTTCPLRRFIAP